MDFLWTFFLDFTKWLSFEFAKMIIFINLIELLETLVIYCNFLLEFNYNFFQRMVHWKEGREKERLKRFSICKILERHFAAKLSLFRKYFRNFQNFTPQALNYVFKFFLFLLNFAGIWCVLQTRKSWFLNVTIYFLFSEQIFQSIFLHVRKFYLNDRKVPLERS